MVGHIPLEDVILVLRLMRISSKGGQASLAENLIDLSKSEAIGNKSESRFAGQCPAVLH